METIYLLTLSLHNLLRWIVLILGITAAVRAWIGWLGKKEWTELDRKLGSFFGIAFDTQLLLGLLLYFVLGSPWTASILSGDFSTAMQVTEMRFFSVEHVFLMVLALVFAHLGSVLAKKAKESAAKYRAAAIWFTLTLLVVLAAIPWARPLIRLG
jgi:hypothetical protein